MAARNWPAVSCVERSAPVRHILSRCALPFSWVVFSAPARRYPSWTRRPASHAFSLSCSMSLRPQRSACSAGIPGRHCRYCGAAALRPFLSRHPVKRTLAVVRWSSGPQSSLINKLMSKTIETETTNTTVCGFIFIGAIWFKDFGFGK